jgi:hypothetical protein
VTETQRKALYAAAAAILAALGAFGIVDSAQTEQVLGIVSGALTLAMAVVPVLAHRKVGVAGVGGGGASTDSVEPLDDPGLPGDEVPVDHSDDVPEHAAEEPSVIPDGEGVDTNQS